ncbi:MAG: homocysteine S-methyltransferase family protein [Verrucomicrobiota bacterium]
MQRIPLLAQLATTPLLADGAMGTQLMARGLGSGECGMLWNVNRRPDVAAVHEAYHRAGSHLITTNSFGGSRYVLERHGLTARGVELNRAAAAIARKVLGETGWVLGDVGPVGDFLEPVGDVSAEDLRAAFRDQIAALIEGGADAILVETMSDPAEAVVGVEAARECSAKIPVVVTYAFQKTAANEFRTMMGTTVAEAVERSVKAGADIIGTNCGTDLGLEDYVVLARQLTIAAGRTPVIVQPNGGTPRIENGRTVYDASPEQMAALASKLISAGASIVGGCCGTTPEHLAAMSRAVKQG